MGENGHAVVDVLAAGRQGPHKHARNVLKPVRGPRESRAGVLDDVETLFGLEFPLSFSGVHARPAKKKYNNTLKLGEMRGLVNHGQKFSVQKIRKVDFNRNTRNVS